MACSPHPTSPSKFYKISKVHIKLHKVYKYTYTKTQYHTDPVHKIHTSAQHCFYWSQWPLISQTQASCAQQRGAHSYRAPWSSIISVSLGVPELSSFTSSSSLVSLKETDCSPPPSTHTVFCSLCSLFRFLLYS